MTVNDCHEETEQDSVRHLSTKPICVPCFLFLGNRLYSASMTFSVFQRAEQLLIKEEAATKPTEPEVHQY